MKTIIEQKGLNFVVTYKEDDLEDLVICSDEQRVRQVLLNLLGNSQKFTYNGKEVKSYSCRLH